MPNNWRTKLRKVAAKEARVKNEDPFEHTNGINAGCNPSASSSGSLMQSHRRLISVNLPQGFSADPASNQCRKCNKTFSDAKARDKHIKESLQHCACRYCDPTIDFGKASALHLHYKVFHAIVFCQLCDEHFRTIEERLLHSKSAHARCDLCLTEFMTRDLLFAHYAKSHPGLRSDPRYAKKIVEQVSDYYVILGISPQSTHDQALKAAKDMRIKTHPDRLKRQQGLSEEQKHDMDVKAGLVGQAADILSDPDLRRKYDLRRYSWEGETSSYSPPKTYRGC